MILLTAAAIITTLAPGQSRPTGMRDFLSFPSDRTHGYQMNCGIFIPQSRGAASRSPMRTLPGESVVGRRSSQTMMGWQNDLIRRYGPPTMVLRPERCSDNIRLVAYATRPEALTNLGAMSTSCPPRSCLRVMPDKAYCGDPKRRGVGKVAYHLLYMTGQGLMSKTTVVDYDMMNRSYFRKPAFVRNPYRVCPLPAE
jgi:hypothetical protein